MNRNKNVSYSLRISEEIHTILDKLSSSPYPILVEGLRDKKALRKLNIPNEIIIINKGHSIVKVVDDLSHLLGPKGKFIILTDWDRTGGNLYRLIKDHSTS